MSAAHTNYALGRTQQEYERLERQAKLIEPMTRRTSKKIQTDPLPKTPFA